MSSNHQFLQIDSWKKTQLYDTVLKAFESNQSVQKEFFLHTASSDDLWLNTYIVPFSANEEKHVLIMLIDVTQRKDFELALYESEKKFRRLLELLPFPVAISNYEEEVGFVNRKFVEVFGYKLEEIPTIENWRELVYRDPKQREQAKKRWYRAMESAIQHNTDILPEESTVTCKDGTVKTIEIFGALIKDSLVVLFNDITEKKKAEKELRRSAEQLYEASERYRTLISASNTGAWEYSEDLDYLWCSREYFSMLGRNVKDYIMSGEKNLNETWINLIHPEDRKNAVQSFKDYLKNPEGMYSSNFRMLHKDGHSVWIWSRGKKIMDENGKPTNKTIGTHIDVTEQKIIEQALVDNENLFRAITEQAAVGISLADIDGNYFLVNDKIAELTFYSKDELLMMNSYDLVPLKSADEKFPNAVNGEPTKREIKLLRRDNSHFYAEVMSSLIQINQKPYILEIIRDITENKLYEDILEFRYKLIELSNKNEMDKIMQYTLDTAEAMTGSNIAFFHFVEADQKTISLQAWSTNTTANICTAEGKDIHYSIDEAGIWVDCVRQKKPVIHNDYNSLAHRKGLPEGHVPIVRELVVPVLRNNIITTLLGVGNKSSDYNDKDIEIVSILADSAWSIIHAKNTEEALRQSENQLRELNKTKDKFFSIIAHDLRAPFHGLLGYSEILIDEYEDLTDEERKNFINGIQSLSSSSYKLLTNLLDWSRLQRGAMDFSPKQLNLLEEINSTVSLLNDTAKSKNIIIDNRINPRHTVYADKNMLETITRNLISNAIKFSHGNSKIIIGSNEEEIFTEIFVKDFGVGIPQNELKNLFKLDQQKSKKGTGNEEGTGLGLHLCKEMVELHKGEIKVTSEEYKGSTFYFTIPKSKPKNSN